MGQFDNGTLEKESLQNSEVELHRNLSLFEVSQFESDLVAKCPNIDVTILEVSHLQNVPLSN